MDNSWQNKCSMVWQSSMPASAPSSQLQPQDSRNQMMNAGHNFYPHVVQEPATSTRKMMLEPLFPYTSRSHLNNSGHSMLGNSFLSPLSGPPSLLQSVPQQLLNSKLFIPPSKDPVSGSSFVVGPAGSGVSLASPELLSPNLDNCHLKFGVDACPVVSSRTAASAGEISASCLHDVLQAANVNDHSSELAKAVNHHNFYGSEQAKEFSSLRAGPFANKSPARTERLHNTSTEAFQKVLEINSSVPRQSSPLKSGCPRVFCFYASGNLLLSNTGLLGVVCSCHGLHMSISKFSEHSGLRDVNPGDAVHMDSGETIDQWRKVYFHKFGHQEHWVVMFLSCFRLGFQKIIADGTGLKDSQQLLIW